MKGRMATQVPCGFCGVMFHPRYDSARRFCSMECAGRAKARVRPDSGLTPEDRAIAVDIAAECMRVYEKAREALS